MAGSINKAILLGHLGKDPETRFTQAGKPVCTFSVATNEKGRGNEKVTWHRIVAWGKLAEICQEHLVKGMQIYVEGRISYQKWTARDGSTREGTEIVAQEMRMLGGDRSRQEPQDEYQPPLHPEDDQIPF